MSFLDKNILECLSAKVTDLGRKRMSEGNFEIKFFKVGDSEYDYAFKTLDQFVLHPVEKDCDLKYPMLLDTQTKVDFGNVAANHSTLTLTEELSEVGVVSGDTINCSIDCIYLDTLTGTNEIFVNDATMFEDCDTVALVLQDALGAKPKITTSSLVYYYKIKEVRGSSIIVDRPTPDLSSLDGARGFVMCMNCAGGQLDPWKMNIVWTEKPAGLDNTYENLSGYGSNAYASAKEYFGYTHVSGQTDNKSTTYRNSVGELITVSPLEQKTIAVIHYSGSDFDHYEDWLAHDADAQGYFALRLPFILYHRSTGTTIGATFRMSADSGYVVSTKNNSPCLGEKYHYLIDEQGVRVGKIFVNKRVIVIDDQEIVAALSMKSNRNYTLPAPKLNYIPSDLPCSPDSGSTVILSGTTKDVWVTYTLVDENDPANDGMHCNYYSKLEGKEGEYNVSVKFGAEFKHMKTSLMLTGFKATKLHAIVQVVDHGKLPSPDSWTVVDITNQIPNHTIGQYISPANLVGYQFILTDALVDSGSLYDLTDYIGALPLQNGGQDEPQFGDEQYLPGSVKAVRGTNVHEMNFLINLPDTQFTTTQNPTAIVGETPVVTEIGLYNSRKELMMIAKTAHPQERKGFQQYAVKMDF